MSKKRSPQWGWTSTKLSMGESDVAKKPWMTTDLGSPEALSETHLPKVRHFFSCYSLKICSEPIKGIRVLETGGIHKQLMDAPSFQEFHWKLQGQSPCNFPIISSLWMTPSSRSSIENCNSSMFNPLCPPVLPPCLWFLPSWFFVSSNNAISILLEKPY